MKDLVNLHLWQLFEMAELTEVMCQRRDLHFIGIINKIKTNSKINFNSRLISNNNQTILAEAIHIYAENAPVDIHNQSMLTTLVTPLIVIKTIHILPDKFFLNANELENVQNMKLSETGDLPDVLNLKIGAQVMITSNINIDDRLVNGMVGDVNIG